MSTSKTVETKVTRQELEAARGGQSQDTRPVTVTCPERYRAEAITAEDILHDDAIQVVASRSKTVEVSLRARVFRGRGVESVLARVEPDGAVLVYDDVAGHYTRVHSMSASGQRRARALAREAR